jgi:hypothetical protein
VTPAATEPLVSFLVAGVQKGGTTALHSYLLEHPELNMGEPKEVHYFDDEAETWARPDYARYHAAFASPGGRLSGEATPIYVYWPESLERIRAYNMAMRLILLFRDPVERAWSQWKMEYARGAETQPFAWCVREGRSRVAESRDPPGHHRVFSYVERGLYGAQLQRVYSLFPREQVLLLLADDLKQQPDQTLRRVCRFLDVAEPARVVEPRDVFVARPFAYPSVLTTDDRQHLRSIFAPDLELFMEMSGLPVRHWLG